MNRESLHRELDAKHHQVSTFEDLQVYQIAREFRKMMYCVAKRLPDIERFGLANQIRRAAVSLTNNIAEGSGSTHPQEFRQFLNISRRSLFEDASMLMVFESLSLFHSGD